MRFILGFSYTGRQNRKVVVFNHILVRTIQNQLAVRIPTDSGLEIVALNDVGYTAKELQSVDIAGYLVLLIQGQAGFTVSVSAVWECAYK